MSVLIEALTLVVRREALELRFPGGVAAFLEAVRRLPRPPRFACADDEHLAQVSFYGPAQLEPCLALLRDQGFQEAATGAAADLTVVDQDLGPTRPCGWLDWVRHADGYTVAWLTGSLPGDLAADPAWTPGRSRSLVRRGARGEAGRLLRLGEQDGVETWLDFTTGRQLVGPTPAGEDAAPGAAAPDELAAFLGAAELEAIDTGAQAPPWHNGSDSGDSAPGKAPASDGRAREAGLGRRIVAGLRAEGLHYRRSARGRLEVAFAATNAGVTVRVEPDEQRRVVRIYGLTEMRIPAEQRGAMCEALTRANHRLPIGNFEMDLATGEVAFKSTVLVADGVLGQRQALAAIRGAVQVFDRYYPAFMRVTWGEASPEEAIAEVEE